MALKQTRRSVSLNRLDYDIIKQEAAKRGMTLVGLIEASLTAFGVTLTVHPQQPPALAISNAARRAARVEARRTERSAVVVGIHATTCAKALDHARTCTCHLATNYAPRDEKQQPSSFP